MLPWYGFLGYIIRYYFYLVSRVDPAFCLHAMAMTDWFSHLYSSFLSEILLLYTLYRSRLSVSWKIGHIIVYLRHFRSPKECPYSLCSLEKSRVSYYFWLLLHICRCTSWWRGSESVGQVKSQVRQWVWPSVPNVWQRKLTGPNSILEGFILRPV